MRTNTKNGFIRIELLILIIVLILSIAVFLLAFARARVEAHDQHRLSDVGQIQKALQVYFGENAIYPRSTSNQPADFKNYLDFWPAPPPADGKCTQDQNQYNYSQKAQGADYTVTFCLGARSGSFAPGFYIINSKGSQ